MTSLVERTAALAALVAGKLGRRAAIPMMVAIALVLPTVANANLIVNGGFETGDLSGWVDGCCVFVTATAPGALRGPHTGNFAAFFDGAEDSFDAIAQTIATVPGRAYRFSFFHANDGGPLDDGLFAFFGATLVELPNSIGEHDYLFESFDLSASAMSTRVTFFGRNNSGWIQLDDVSVVLVDEAPEPATLALLGFGVLSLAVICRRRRLLDASR